MAMHDHYSLDEAKHNIRSHIKFFKMLLRDLKKNNEQLKGCAKASSWCLQRYFEDNFFDELTKIMKAREQKH